MTLNPEQREGFMEKLQKEEQHLLFDLREIEKNKNFGDDVDDFEEKTDETEEMANTLGVKHSLDSQLAEVRSAIERLNAGTYGVCTKCGRDIELAVLEAFPSSALCKECKRGA